jgi:hypothetical protein
MSSDIEATVAEIRAWHRRRVFMMDQRKRSDLALGAFLRRHFGWSRDKPEAERKAIAKVAGELIECGEAVLKGKPHRLADTEEWADVQSVVMASLAARAPLDAVESEATKKMEALARTLPVWAGFGEDVKGFGARSLAVVVAEAGDLSNYATVAKLWKRMGLAVMNGIRQGGLRKTASADDWIAHGYSAARRSYMFVIGDVLVKNQGVYREVYLARKAYERERAEAAGLTVVPAAKIPAKRQAEFMSDGHVHRRAQRYMEKRVLKDLWIAWRQANETSKPMAAVPAVALAKAA